jgi:hypothetical protein
MMMDIGSGYSTLLSLFELFQNWKRPFANMSYFCQKLFFGNILKDDDNIGRAGW